MFSRIALTLAGGLLAASPVAAQQASASEPIVVEGIANSQKQIDRFIKKLTPGPIHGQLSRFQTKVCPLSIGLTPERNALVVKRMRDVAAAARIPLAEPDCRPNIILIVTNNKAALIEQLLRKRSYMFPDAWSMATIHALERDPSPDAAWAIEGVTSAGGQPLNYGSEVPVNRTTRAASRLTTAVVPYFAAAVLVVQTNALDGLTTTQLADYAAMRTFVRTDPKLIDPSNSGHHPDAARDPDGPAGAADADGLGPVVPQVVLRHAPGRVVRISAGADARADDPRAGKAAAGGAAITPKKNHLFTNRRAEGAPRGKTHMATAQNVQSDRRRVERLALRLNATMRDSTRSRVRARVIDMSSRGCRIECTTPVEDDSWVWLSIAGLENQFCRVVWHHEEFIGLEFEKPLSDAVFERLLADQGQLPETAIKELRNIATRTHWLARKAEDSDIAILADLSRKCAVDAVVEGLKRGTKRR